MTDNPLLLGIWRYLLPIPPSIWKRQAAANGQNLGAGLSFMTPDHHRVRNFAVVELPRCGRPLEPGDFAAGLGLAEERVVQILDDLETHMTFVFRSDRRAVDPAAPGTTVTSLYPASSGVDWAYPVAIGPTPHHVAFSTGERIDAA